MADPSPARSLEPTIRATDYGKRDIPVYRFRARPLEGVTPIPESPFRGRDNRLVAARVGVQVLGENFEPSYTEGDNAAVVATDSMKNFVLERSLAWEGSTHEDLLHFLGAAFLARYPQMERVGMDAVEVPFAPELVPGDDGGFVASPVLFSAARGDRGSARLRLERDDAAPRGARIAEHRCGRLAMQLVKTTGSSFARFVRDDHTTLPEVEDRPLYIHLDVAWRYREPLDALARDPARYVASEQVRDLCAAVFHELNSRSIQELVYRMGVRALERFEPLDEIAFEAQNRLWDPAYADDDDPLRMVRTDPRPPYGDIGLTLGRGDLPDAADGSDREA